MKKKWPSSYLSKGKISSRRRAMGCTCFPHWSPTSSSARFSFWRYLQNIPWKLSRHFCPRRWFRGWHQQMMRLRNIVLGRRAKGEWEVWCFCTEFFPIFLTSSRGILKKSLRASLATDFFTSLQYGVWKSKASKEDSVVVVFTPFFEAFLQNSW